MQYNKINSFKKELSNSFIYLLEGEVRKRRACTRLHPLYLSEAQRTPQQPQEQLQSDT